MKTSSMKTKEMDKEKILANILLAFIDSGECNEQDFIRALIDFIPNQSSNQSCAIRELKSAIGFLDADDKISIGGYKKG